MHLKSLEVRQRRDGRISLFDLSVSAQYIQNCTNGGNCKEKVAPEDEALKEVEVEVKTEWN